MGRRNIISFKPFVNADMSVEQIQAIPSTIDGVDKIGITVDWTGTSPVGVLTVEVSNYDQKSQTFTGWKALDFGTAINIGGNSGSHTINIQDPPFQKMRLHYMPSSGTGLINAAMFGANKGA